MKTVVLTGAGISAESGLATFRGDDGLWDNEPIEEVATPEGFHRDPARVHRFYNDRRKKLGQVRPNDAHHALAAFEARHQDDFLLITQNVDDLHERAGSHPHHMHGELLKARCVLCAQTSAVADDLFTDSPCPHCREAGGMRPDVVWFGEMPYGMSRMEAALENCQLFVAIGTSGQVYPAAGFVRLAKHSRARCVEINLNASENESLFDEKLVGKATQAVPEFFAGL